MLANTVDMFIRIIYYYFATKSPRQFSKIYKLVSTE